MKNNQSEKVIKAKKEMARMIRVYQRSPYRNGAFLAGSSILGNSQGDSRRFQELKKIIKNDKNKEKYQEERHGKLINILGYVSVFYGIYLIIMQDILSGLGGMIIMGGFLLKHYKKEIIKILKEKI